MKRNHSRLGRYLAGVIGSLLAGGLVLAALASPALAQAPETEVWDGYLDFAYVYASADHATLEARIARRPLSTVWAAPPDFRLP